MGWYDKCDAASRNELKNTFLRLMTTETVNVVRTALAGVVSRLAKAVFTNGEEWEDLFNMLMQLIHSEEPTLRALCFNLLGQVHNCHTHSLHAISNAHSLRPLQLAEQVPDNMKPHISTIAEMMLAGCNDPDISVSTASVVATTVFVGMFLANHSLSLSPVLCQLQSINYYQYRNWT